MAYKTEELSIITLSEGCDYFRNKFKNENDFVQNLLPKLHSIILNAYGLTIESIELEKKFDLTQVGLFNIRCDVYIRTIEGKDILIECKNPRHNKAETFNAFGQLMSYQYLLSKTPFKPIIILATSVFEVYYFDFIKEFNLKFDIILNNENQTAFWNNEFTNGI